jgi:hypothetical protein
MGSVCKLFEEHLNSISDLGNSGNDVSLLLEHINTFSESGNFGNDVRVQALLQPQSNVSRAIGKIN